MPMVTVMEDNMKLKTAVATPRSLGASSSVATSWSIESSGVDFGKVPRDGSEVGDFDHAINFVNALLS